MRHALIILLLSTVFVPALAAAQAIDLLDAARASAASDEGVAIAAEAVRAAEARRREARAGLLPEVTVSTTVTRNDRDVSVGGRTVAHLWDTAAQASLRVSVFDASAIPGLASSSRRIDVAESEAAAARAALRAATARLFIDALAARTRLDLAAEAVTVAEATRDQVGARHDAGFALATDVDQAELSVLRARAAQLDAETALDDAMAGLAFALNRPLIDADTLGDPTLPRAADTGSGVRPEQEALAAELAAADLALRSARWAFAPTVALTGRYDIGRESLRAPDGRSWTLAMTFSWVLYDPARYARIDAAESVISVASLEARRLERELIEARQAATRQLRQSETRVELTERAVEVAESAHRLMRDRFELGEATLLEMTEADAARVSALLDATLARFDREQARIDLLLLDGAFDDDAPDMEAP